MRKIALYVLFIFIPLFCMAQNDRVINGVVYSENGSLIAGATVSGIGANLFAKTDSEGKFVITVPIYVKELQVECPGYHSLSQDIDGSFMVFKMKLDKKYAEKVFEYASIEAKLAKDSERRIIEAEAARVKAEKNARRMEIDALYNQKYKNIGFVHSIELTYGYQTGKGDVVYKNLGYREYTNLHPVELDYTLGYRFHNFFSLGIGTGLQYQLVNLCSYPDVFDPGYSDIEKFTPVNVPLFLNTKMYMSRGKCQPLFSFSGGAYLPNFEGLVDLGVGVNLRLSKVMNFYFLFSCRTTCYGDFREYKPGIFDAGRNFLAYYKDVAWTPSFKIGCTF